MTNVQAIADFCAMKKSHRLVSSYSLEELLKRAAKYPDRTSFHNGDRTAARAARLLGYYELCTAHMVEKQKPKGYWTKPRCHKEALRFETREDFEQGCMAAYQAARKKGWLDDICGHMVVRRVKKGFWRNEGNLSKKAGQYDCRKAFAKGAPGAYGAATAMGVLEKICQHMAPVGNAANKLIYAHEFPDGYAYVGMSFNLTNRERHRSQSSVDAVVRHQQQTGLASTLKALTPLLPVKTAIRMEAKFCRQYKQKGWILLNTSKPGAVGGNIIIWTKGKTVGAARGCSTKAEFYNEYGSAYDAACRNDWIKDCYRHIRSSRKPPGFWIEPTIEQVAVKYKTKGEFERQCGSAYTAAIRLGILDKVCRHMKVLKRPNNYWTYERVLHLAKKCRSIKQFVAKYRNAYQAARRKRWLDKIYREVGWTKQTYRLQLTFAEVVQIAKACRSISDFTKRYRQVYEFARKYNWLGDLYNKMNWKRKTHKHKAIATNLVSL
jgi:hypothetical protein